MTAPAAHPATATGPQPLAERAWFNALWFQATWLCLVLGRESLLTLGLGLSLLALHLFLVTQPGRELRQLACVGGLGIIVDAGLSAAGVYQFAGDVLVPLWLCVLWLAFASTLTRSLAFIARRRLLAALAGAIAMPFNYWAGQRLGAVDFGYALLPTLVVIGATWALALPLLATLALRWSKEARHD